VGTYTHTINTYASYILHFDTPLQTVNQIIPTFIHSFIHDFDQSDSIHNFIHSFFIHDFDQSDSIHNFIHSFFIHDSNFHFRSTRFIRSIHSQFRPTRFIRSIRFIHSFGHSFTISTNSIHSINSLINPIPSVIPLDSFIQSIEFLVGASPTEVRA